MTDAPHGRTPNRLAREKSPYLLQHALNPVDWYPWGEEAFAKARAEGKPIFLSIGYSTCHWCHVMERESFENAEVAALLNDLFVPVKVDREERPDVDRLYMASAQAMGVGGGWPLNVFLTPALEPFFGGTYFPPESRWGRPGMKELLPRVAEAWATRRDEVAAGGARVLEAIAALDRADAAHADRERVFERAYAYFERAHDAAHGGFGGAPKFPSVVNLDYLMRVWARDPARRREPLAMVVTQLEAMRAGGIHDHLGGGFHRYATDREWLVPHFEKMLYDQAQLAWVLADVFLATGDPAHRDTARGVLDYVARDLSSPEGGFLSAEDADSEGVEGKFYLWTPAQVADALPELDAKLACFRWGITPQGNFEHGQTILTEARTVEACAAEFGLAPEAARGAIEAARAALLEARARRPRPHRDDKVLTAWNGLMIAAFARCARAFDDAALAARGARAADFLWQRLWDPAARAFARRWREGEAAGAGQLDDHAYAAFGFLELHQATADPAWLERAAEVVEAMVARFWDDADGAFFESPPDDPSVRVRMKDGFDGAEIAGNSIAVWVLEALGRLLDRPPWRARAARAMDYYARRLGDGAAAMPRMLVAFDLAAAPVRHVVIAGDPEAADTRALVRAFDARFRPNDLRLVVDGGERQRRLAALAPWLATLAPVGGRAAAYVCVDHACRLPVTEPAELEALLAPAAAAADPASEIP
uniref:Thioredoxin domain-containing protein n=1 Tax=Eiseniibacteriota bacterium TaxID=2212470 RepID=A0A832I5R4_UNCEI